MVWDIGHPSWITFLTSGLTIQDGKGPSDHQGKLRDMNWFPQQHPMSKNIASGRLFTNPRTRGYAGALET